MMPALLISRSTGSSSSRATASTEARSVTSMAIGRTSPPSERSSVGGLLGLAAGGEHPPAVGGVLAGELVADAAIGAGDENGWHVGLLAVAG